jgi:predicted ATP-dependent endonuclease of OLD family
LRIEFAAAEIYHPSAEGEGEMRLKSFRVFNFQSVLDSGLIEIEQCVCLVGKNEAGKSAILKALYKLNPVRTADGQFNITDDYPRSLVTAFQARIKKDKASEKEKVVEVIYEMEEDEIASVSTSLGDRFLKGNTVTLTKYYDNSRSYYIECDEDEASTFLLSRVSSEAKTAAANCTSPQEIKTALSAFSSEPEVSGVLALLNEIGGKSFCYYAWKLLSLREPKYLYFDEYYQMRGCENIESLLKRQADKNPLRSDEPLLGLINLAGIELNELQNVQRTQELKNRLQGASVSLTKQILPYWSQNKHVQLQFDIRPALPGDPEGMKSGTNIWGEVYDTKQYASTGLGARSKGFVWFFSFVAWYSEVRQNDENTILLLDEPGLTLHGRAQGDLLRYFEVELLPNNQLIYSTHSPFMVDPHNFERVRIVQNLSVEQDDPPPQLAGTRLVPDLMDATEDSLFPLQGALGYDIHQTLFIGPNSLLVEGPADMLFIQAISSVLEQEGKVGLSNKWIITPVGGASKVPTFVRLLTNQKGMRTATLVDVSPNEKKQIEKLYAEKILKRTNVRTYADYNGSSEADVEDMFDVDFYLELVNAEFSDQLIRSITESDLVSKSPRILKRIEHHLEKVKLKSGKFSHYRPARYFHDNLERFRDKISAETKRRFEAAFIDLNDLLK